MKKKIKADWIRSIQGMMRALKLPPLPLSMLRRCRMPDLLALMKFTQVAHANELMKQGRLSFGYRQRMFAYYDANLIKD